jgi:hypothetical protein
MEPYKNADAVCAAVHCRIMQVLALTRYVRGAWSQAMTAVHNLRLAANRVAALWSQAMTAVHNLQLAASDVHLAALRLLQAGNNARLAQVACNQVCVFNKLPQQLLGKCGYASGLAPVLLAIHTVGFLRQWYICRHSSRQMQASCNKSMYRMINGQWLTDCTIIC